MSAEEAKKEEKPAAEEPKAEEKAEEKAPAAAEDKPAEEKPKEDKPKKGGRGQPKGGRGQGGRGGGARTGGVKQQLVEQIKENQRSDAGWRRAWANYCQMHGQDVRDPQKHAQSWLQRALQTLGGSHSFGGSAGYSRAGASMYQNRQASAHCIEQVKANQRADAGWHQAWTNYCLIHGAGVSDPAKHSDRWIVRACRTLGAPQVPYQYLDHMGMVQTVFVPLNQQFVPHFNPQPRTGGYNRSRGGYSGGAVQQRSRGGYSGGRPRSRGSGGIAGGSRGGGGFAPRAGPRSRGGGGGSTGAPRSRGGGNVAVFGAPRSRGGHR